MFNNPIVHINNYTCMFRQIILHRYSQLYKQYLIMYIVLTWTYNNKIVHLVYNMLLKSERVREMLPNLNLNICK